MTSLTALPATGKQTTPPELLERSLWERAINGERALRAIREDPHWKGSTATLAERQTAAWGALARLFAATDTGQNDAAIVGACDPLLLFNLGRSADWQRFTDLQRLIGMIVDVLQPVPYADNPEHVWGPFLALIEAVRSDDEEATRLHLDTLAALPPSGPAEMPNRRWWAQRVANYITLVNDHGLPMGTRV